MLARRSDAELRGAGAKRELPASSTSAARGCSSSSSRCCSLPQDPNDDKNVVLEIRAGTGGDEARCSPATSSACTRATPSARLEGRDPRRRQPAGLGGFKEVIAADRRQGASTPRSSSSPACTACSACPRPRRRAASTPRPRPSPCCPRPKKSTSKIDEKDLEIDVYRSSGAGRSGRQHDRLGGAHHAHADRHGRHLPGRALAASRTARRR